jgi:hypothetical protein
MKKTKSRILIGACFALFVLSGISLMFAQEAKYKDILGTWDVETEDSQYAFEFIFSMEKDNLKGVFIGTSGETDMEKLSYEDNKLTFTVNVEAGGQSMAIDFSATIEGDSLDGMLSLEFGEANISGKKRK